jgi:hypothetical protein
MADWIMLFDICGKQHFLERRVWNKYACAYYVENFGQGLRVAFAQIHQDDVEEFVRRLNAWRPAHTCVDGDHLPCLACERGAGMARVSGGDLIKSHRLPDFPNGT